MSVKASLKAAKAALDAGDYANAATEAEKALGLDATNYFARLFLARALEKQGRLDDAAKTYHAAATSKPDDNQAWLGLCSVYEAQGGEHLAEYLEAATKAAAIYAAADDRHRCQGMIDKLVSFTKRYGSALQYRRALETMLPESPLFEALEGRVPHPSVIYTRIAEITETDESSHMQREVANRRTRIGARLGQVTTEVEREVFAASDLEVTYHHVIDWTSDDVIRREYEEKLFLRAYKTLTVIPPEQKATKLDQVLTLAEGMVVIKHPFMPAWDTVFESRDLEELQGLDINVVMEYVTFFPESGLSKVIQAWMSSNACPFFHDFERIAEDDDAIRHLMSLSAEDRLSLLTDGMSVCESSCLAHRLAGEYYLHIEEYESVVDVARAGQTAAATESQKLGLAMQNTLDALNGILATGLVYVQTPRNHPEARRLFEGILQRKPKYTRALVGLGLILEENEDYEGAIQVLQTALEQTPEDIRVATELAWCRALDGDHDQAQKSLEESLSRLDAKDQQSRDLRAETLHRIGVCIWHRDPSKAARRDRQGAYARFIASIKTNVNYAPAYSSLGLYYADYAKDKKRARQCFQKAFELSSAQIDAAKRLAQSYANQSDWDVVEVIAQRVVDSGRARPPPGSKRKGVSWPYSALGVVQMNRQDYQRAIVSFLAALRIDPHDFQSYIGLGESYHNSGRYNSALRTFEHALNPPPDTQMNNTGDPWFARYMLANVYRELGEHDQAIDGLRAVLNDRPKEFGVSLSLLQAYVEKSWRCVEKGLFGQAVESANLTIDLASSIVKDHSAVFNVWKAIGDACSVYQWVQGGVDQFPSSTIKDLVSTGSDGGDGLLQGIDGVGLTLPSEAFAAAQASSLAIAASVCAYKRSIASSAHDIHAQAVAWYNLGWAEFRAFTCSKEKSNRRYLKAAVRCFKRAIELEAGNAEFWNALGVVTSNLNPKVAQHAFVRSLHLNELNAKVWTNLGVLYVLQNDHELAHQAFGRAQSTDPDYAHAWVGEGLVALLIGNVDEALNHFTHAFEISDAASVVTKRQYATSSFDRLLSTFSTSTDPTSMIQPLFALEQLKAQVPSDTIYRHMNALFLERVRNHDAAVEEHTQLCTIAEEEYEKYETLAALARYAQAKSDLSRNLLAVNDFENAYNNAETALDLTSDAANCGLDADQRRRLRLSAHLTAGLTSSRLNNSSEAISKFRSALEESENDPDVVVVLVQILWTHGGTDERSVAHDQLLACVESHPDHIGSLTLLGAIAGLEDDDETLAAVHDDLLSARTRDNLTSNERNEIETLLLALSRLAVTSAADEDTAVTAIQTAVALDPTRDQGWSALADHSNEPHLPQMALLTTQKEVPPGGDRDAAQLASTHAAIGTVGDAQRAVALAPWDVGGWRAMFDGVQCRS